MIHAFIISRLDYCNSLYAGISQTALSRLQLVQNAEARLLTGVHKQDHISPVLHWLPVCYRVDLKNLQIVYKSLNCMAPSYISDLLLEHNVTRSLRSSNQRLLFIPKMRRKCRGFRAFSTIAPRLWNDLPAFIRIASSVAIFKSKLKAYLFDKAFNSGWSTLYSCPMFLLHVMMYFIFPSSWFYWFLFFIVLLLFLVILL